MTKRQLSVTAGVNYLIIFVTAIFANFFVLDSLKSNPLEMVQSSSGAVRLGIIAFLVAAVCDVIIAWALRHLYDKNILTDLSTYFRVIHAAIMGAAVFALLDVLAQTEPTQILQLVEKFNTLWLVGLFFFGFHLILLARIAQRPKLITIFLAIAGVMYIIDTLAHFGLQNYAAYADVFLALVAIPSIFGEMAFGLWLLFKGGKTTSN